MAFDLITGTPQSLTSFETSTAYSPHLTMSQDNMHRPRTMSQNTKAPQRSSKRTTSFSRTGSGLPMPPSNYEDSRSVFNQSGRPLSSSTAGMSNIDKISRSYPLINQTQQTPLDPRLQTFSTVSEADTDPLANEFAALDAMEWYTSPSHPLVDSTNTHQQDRQLGPKPSKPRLHRPRQHESRFLCLLPRARSLTPEQHFSTTGRELECRGDQLL